MIWNHFHIPEEQHSFMENFISVSCAAHNAILEQCWTRTCALQGNLCALTVNTETDATNRPYAFSSASLEIPPFPQKSKVSNLSAFRSSLSLLVGNFVGSNWKQVRPLGSQRGSN
jgi:hypothetical protein